MTLGYMRSRRQRWQTPSLQRLQERPFRTLPGELLLKFLRRLSGNSVPPRTEKRAGEQNRS